MNRLEIKNKDNRHNKRKMDTDIFGLREELHKQEKMSRKYENDGMEKYCQECFLKIKKIYDSKDLIDQCANNEENRKSDNFRSGKR